MEIYYHITEKSSNRKTGPIPVLTSSYRTCSDTCPFKDNGCYGDGGPLRLHWEKVSTGADRRALTFKELIEKIPVVAEKSKRRGVKRIRLWQVGDMPGLNRRINIGQTRNLVNALKGFEMPFGYTHKPLDGENGKIIRYCNDNGVIINLSANNLTHADFLLKLGIGPVSVTLPDDVSNRGLVTPDGKKVVVCPAVISDHMMCATCGGGKGPLCWRVDRDYIVGFPAHGFRVRKASEVARETKVKY